MYILFSFFLKRSILKFLTSSFDILIKESFMIQNGDNKYGLGLNKKLEGTSVSNNLL